MEARRSRIVMVAALVVVLPAAGLVLMAADNNAPFLPGITVEDEHPNGCVDCHVNAGANRDYRINLELANNVPGHPKIDRVVKTVPNDCAICHKAGAKAGELSAVVHKAHYDNFKENAFVQHYQGACLNCHNMDPATGAVTLKSGPKNW